MKYNVSIFFLLITLVILSCNRNRLKTDEKSLTQQILTDEEQLAQEAELSADREKQLTDSLAKLPKGIRLKGERNTDPLNPPEIIDIAGNLNQFGKFALSDIVSEIKYIRLQMPEDSAFTGKVNFKSDVDYKQELPLAVKKNKDFIVAYNYLGILLYSAEGKLLKTICSNELNNFELGKNYVKGGSNSTIKGANNTPFLIGNNLYYNYEDRENGISELMQVDCNNLPLSMSENIENKSKYRGIGSPVAFTGKNSYSVIPLGSNLFTKKGDPKRNEDMLTIYSAKGDTLCSFHGNQKIENYTSNVSRSPDFGSSFQYKGNYFFREPHSDTIFRIVPPSRLIPKFILKLGEYKVERIQDAMNPKYNLADKFIMSSLSISDSYVLIHYTKGYNSPNARRNKKVKFYHAIYDRQNKTLKHIQYDPDKWKFSLENDIDGGLSFWPYFSVSEQEEFLMSVKGSDLKEHIKTDGFLNTTAPGNKKAAFLDLAQKVDNHETIVIIMKQRK
jgi:hypothetical protein